MFWTEQDELNKEEREKEFIQSLRLKASNALLDGPCNTRLVQAYINAANELERVVRLKARRRKRKGLHHEFNNK